MTIELKISVTEQAPESDGTIRGKVIMEPLFRGFGHTMGNTLRRVLLGRLKGTAVTHVRFEGANHEFTSLEGVSEDILNIILNIKSLVIKMDTEEPRTLTLKASGQGTVKASQIECPSGVEIINKDLEIANLAQDGKLGVEIKVARGYGYVTAEEHETAQAVDVIAVDSVFMPIKNVSYSIEPISIAGQNAKFDRLVLDIWSNGAISVNDAVGQAAAQVTELMNPLVQYTGQKVGVIKTVEEKTETPQKEEDKVFNISVEELELSVRSYNCLKRANINSLADLLCLSDIDLMNIKNFGKKSAEEVLEKLETLGYSLKDKEKNMAVLQAAGKLPRG
jgi:DNA-directed RNA polymerase subunit alpha